MVAFGLLEVVVSLFDHQDEADRTSGRTRVVGERTCFHCGLPVPEEVSLSVNVLGKPRPMCCPGCQAVAQAIVAGGLEAFYAHRTAPSRRPEELVPEKLQRLAVYDQPALRDNFVKPTDQDLKTAALILEGITCAACVWLNERHVSALPGVVEFQINYSTHRAHVQWDDSRVHLSDILRAVSEIGYNAYPFDVDRQEEVLKREKANALRRLVIAGLCTMQVMMLAVALYAGEGYGMEPGLQRFMRWISAVLCVPVVFYSSTTFFKAAWRDLRQGRLGMDVPVSLAIGGAYGASIFATLTDGDHVYFDSVCMFSFFLLVSRYLEMGARHRANQAAEALVKLLPATAAKIVEGKELLVAVADLIVGDEVLIRPGEAVPADGTVIAGSSSVDESLLTGESLPRPRLAGDPLVGGSINVESPLHMRVESIGEDTLLAGIVRLLDRAQSEKPRFAHVADRVAGWFVAGLLLIAIGVAWWWGVNEPERAFAVTLSVLVVTCPCALSLATPTAVTAATGALTKLGLLVTRGNALETLARAGRVLFDKTGTLTRGELRLSGVRLFGELAEQECVAIAAALEQGAEHPVARAILSATEESLAAVEVTARPGCGIEGTVQGRRYRLGTPAFACELAAAPMPKLTGSAVTAVVLADERAPLAVFELHDGLRSDAQRSVVRLQELGLGVEILSGDAEGAVAQVAASLGLTEWRSGLMPNDKLARVTELQSQGEIVVAVGDGVNDAPVLAGANVSIAMGGGAQIAHASADLLMLSERLEVLPLSVQLARRTLSVVKQNLGWALLYNLVAIPLAASGVVAPWMAAIGMSLSSLVVVFNAWRLRWAV